MLNTKSVSSWCRIFSSRSRSRKIWIESILKVFVIVVIVISFFFSKNCILTNFSYSQSLVKILWRSDKDKNTFKAIEKHRYGLRKTVSKHLNKRTDFMLSTAYSCFCSLTINKLHQERILRYREGNAQSSPWGHVNFTKLIFRPIKPVKLT